MMVKRQDASRARWWDRLNRGLLPVMGPAQLGPFDQPPLPPTGAKPCPLCGQPMDAHRIARTADDHTPTRLYCPEPIAAG